MKFHKKLLFLLLVLALFIPGRAEAKDDLKIYVNDRLIETDVKPYIKEGRTMVPLRFISEAFGMEVEWGKQWNDMDDKEFIYALARAENGREIYITEYLINSSDGIYFLFEKKFYEGVVRNEIKNDRFFVGLRYLANALHFDIRWDQATNSVYLQENNEHEIIPYYMNREVKAENRYETFDIEWKDGFYKIKGKDITFADLPMMYAFRGLEMEDYARNNYEKFSQYLDSLEDNYNLFDETREVIMRKLSNNIYMDVDRKAIIGVNAG